MAAKIVDLDSLKHFKDKLDTEVVGDLTSLPTTAKTLAEAIGEVDGKTVSLNTSEIKLGTDAGHTNQGTHAIAVGYHSGSTNQGVDSIAIGNNAGHTDLKTGSVAIGKNAGNGSIEENSLFIKSGIDDTHGGSITYTNSNHTFELTNHAKNAILKVNDTVMDISKFVTEAPKDGSMYARKDDAWIKFKLTSSSDLADPTGAKYSVGEFRALMAGDGFRLPKYLANDAHFPEAPKLSLVGLTDLAFAKSAFIEKISDHYYSLVVNIAKSGLPNRHVTYNLELEDSEVDATLIGSSGSTSFNHLGAAPEDLTGAAGKFLTVKQDESGYEFVTGMKTDAQGITLAVNNAIRGTHTDNTESDLIKFTDDKVIIGDANLKKPISVMDRLIDEHDLKYLKEDEGVLKLTLTSAHDSTDNANKFNLITCNAIGFKKEYLYVFSMNGSNLADLVDADPLHFHTAKLNDKNGTEFTTTGLKEIKEGRVFSFDGTDFTEMNYNTVESTDSQIKLGLDAGKTSQGTNAIAIGEKAGETNQEDYSLDISSFDNRTTKTKGFEITYVDSTKEFNLDNAHHDAVLKVNGEIIGGSESESTYKQTFKEIGNATTDTDLNDIRQTGFYRSSHSSNKFLNIPNLSIPAFTLFIESASHDNDNTHYLRQTLKDFASNKQWIRVDIGDSSQSWHPWILQTDATQLGDLADLDTTYKTDIVGAINEVKNAVPTVDFTPYVKKAGDTMTGDLNVGVHKVHSVSSTHTGDLYIDTHGTYGIHNTHGSATLDGTSGELISAKQGTLYGTLHKPTSADVGAATDAHVGNVATLKTTGKVVVTAINENHDALTTAHSAANALTTRVTHLETAVGDHTKLPTTSKEVVGAITENHTAIEVLKPQGTKLVTEVGDLTKLTTTHKTDLVGAINDNHASIGTAHTAATALTTRVTKTETEIGDLTTLDTTATDTLVKAINENNTALLSNTGDITALTTRVHTNEGHITTAQADITQAKTDITTNHTSIGHNTTNVAANKTSITALETKYHAEVGTVADLTTTSKVVVGALNELKTSVDGIDTTSYVEKSGSTMTGDLTMGAHNILFGTNHLHAVSNLLTSSAQGTLYGTSHKPSASDVGAATSAHLGDVSHLATTHKTDAVGAINEIHTAVHAIKPSFKTLTDTPSDFSAGAGKGVAINHAGDALEFIDLFDFNNTTVKIGTNAGQVTPGANTVAIGNNSGQTKQGAGAVAIGNSAGSNTQGANAVAIGNEAGTAMQHEGSIAIGHKSGASQPEYSLDISSYDSLTTKTKGFGINYTNASKEFKFDNATGDAKLLVNGKEVVTDIPHVDLTPYVKKAGDTMTGDLNLGAHHLKLGTATVAESGTNLVLTNNAHTLTLDNTGSVTTTVQGKLYGDKHKPSASDVGAATSAHLGDITKLTTTHKTDVVGAVSENHDAIHTNTGHITTVTAEANKNKTDIATANTHITTNTGHITTNTTGIATNKTGVAHNVTAINLNKTHIGDVTKLSTTHKTDLVNALNEVNTAVHAIKPTFISATDTPANFINEKGKVLAVNQDENAVEFIDLPTPFNPETTIVKLGQYAAQITPNAHVIAIGAEAGQNNQGEESIAIGYQAGQSDLPAHSIVVETINAAKSEGGKLEFDATNDTWDLTNHDSSAKLTVNGKEVVMDASLDPAYKTKLDHITITKDLNLDDISDNIQDITYDTTHAVTRITKDIVRDTAQADISDITAEGNVLASTKRVHDMITSETTPIKTHLGDVTKLSTTHKTDTVGAINENHGVIHTNTGHITTNTSGISTNKTHIGDITTLGTGAKSNLVDAINENHGTIASNTSRITSNSNTMMQNFSNIADNKTAISANEIAIAVNKAAIANHPSFDPNTDNIKLGNNAGQAGQSTDGIAIGKDSASVNQGLNSVALGVNAGHQVQGTLAVAIGNNSGQTTQQTAAVAIGSDAGNTNQGQSSVAMGWSAGSNAQSSFAVALGPQAGNSEQGLNAIAIGYDAGQTKQGQNAIAIGHSAGANSQGANSIVIGPKAGDSHTEANAIIVSTMDLNAGAQISYTVFDNTWDMTNHNQAAKFTFNGKDIYATTTDIDGLFS